MSLHPVQWSLKKRIRDHSISLANLGALTSYDNVYLSKVLNGHVLSVEAIKAMKVALKNYDNGKRALKAS